MTRSSILGLGFKGLVITGCISLKHEKTCLRIPLLFECPHTVAFKKKLVLWHSPRCLLLIYRMLIWGCCRNWLFWEGYFTSLICPFPPGLTCRACKSAKALAGIVWMLLLCSISNSNLLRPEKSVSVNLTKLLYLEYKWHAKHKLSLSIKVQMSKQTPTTTTHTHQCLSCFTCAVRRGYNAWNIIEIHQKVYPLPSPCSMVTVTLLFLLGYVTFFLIFKPLGACCSPRLECHDSTPALCELY